MSETTIFRFEHGKADDTGDIQLVDGLGHANESFEKVIRVQPHGFTSNPPMGSHGLGLRARNESELPIVLGLEHQDKRVKNLQPGQAAVYDDHGNTSKYLGSGGIVHDAGSNPQAIKGKKVTIAAKGDNASIGSDQKTYLGGDGTDGTYSPVMTQDGPSTTVFAKL